VQGAEAKMRVFMGVYRKYSNSTAKYKTGANLFGASVEIEDIATGRNEQVQEVQSPPSGLVVHAAHQAVPEGFLRIG